MQRTKKQQLETLISSKTGIKGKSILKTRGSNPLIQSLEPKLYESKGNGAKKRNDGLKALLIILGILMVAISVLLDFNIYFNIILALCATAFIWNLEKRDKIKHKVKIIEEKIDYSIVLTNNEIELNDEIRAILLNIHTNIYYLLGLDNLKNNINHLHYINSCKDKHLNDIIKNLLSTHISHKAETENIVLNQLQGINKNIQMIIDEHQKDLQNNIKVKEIFKPD